MARQSELSLMIVVKAAPVLTAELQESMCVAALDLGPEPGWIRLFPVPFRDLADDSKFRKYQELTFGLHDRAMISDPSLGYRSRGRSAPAESSDLNMAGRLDVSELNAWASGPCVI